ncbi:MAG: DNA glycosylase AlkZ-like family protein, partial [Aeromicrobium sp.]
MTAALPRARAPYQRLVGPLFSSPEAVVSHFGCMQSQDFAMARLAQTYLRGHGPSRPADLSWWSRLT